MSCSRYLFQAVETNSREIEDNPNEKGIPTRYAFLRSEFSSPRDDLRARILQNRAASPYLRKRLRANAGALSQKRGFACASDL